MRYSADGKVKLCPPGVRGGRVTWDQPHAHRKWFGRLRSERSEKKMLPLPSVCGATRVFERLFCSQRLATMDEKLDINKM